MWRLLQFRPFSVFYLSATSMSEHIQGLNLSQLTTYEYPTMTDIVFRSQVSDDGVTKIM